MSLAVTFFYLTILDHTWHTLILLIQLFPLFSRDGILPSELKFRKKDQVCLKQKKVIIKYITQ